MKGASIMTVTRVLVLATALLAAAVPVHAEISDGVIKIGIMNDQSGTYADLAGPGSVVVKTGGDTWFFLTADYKFGHDLERDTEAVVIKNGGKVIGKVRHPFPNADFSSFLLQAQASKAKVIGLANAGADTTNAMKQGAEFGIVRGGQQFAGLLVFLTDVHALGLEKAQGLLLNE